MKTIGLIGGMSWESTVPYYKIINEVIKEKLGGLHSAKMIQTSKCLIQHLYMLKKQHCMLLKNRIISNEEYLKSS